MTRCTVTGHGYLRAHQGRCNNNFAHRHSIPDGQTLMLDWLKETEQATRLEAAVARVIAEGRVWTYDMGGKHSTLDVAKAVADYAG